MRNFDYHQNLAKILKHLRISQNLSQAEMAHILGCSRLRLLRLENGKAKIDLVEGSLMMQYFKISFNDIAQGFIDLPLQNNNFDLFKINKNLTKDPYSKGHTLAMHIWNFKKHFGEKAFSEFCAKEKVDELFFVNLKNSLNMDFNLRLIQSLVMSGSMKTDNEFDVFTKKIWEVPQIKNELDFFNKYQGVKKISAFVNRATDYEENHEYRIEEEKDKTIFLSVKPRKHVNQHLYCKDPFISGFFEKLLKSVFTNFGQAHFETELIEKSSNHCRMIYQISEPKVLHNEAG